MPSPRHVREECSDSESSSSSSCSPSRKYKCLCKRTDNRCNRPRGRRVHVVRPVATTADCNDSSWTWTFLSGLISIIFLVLFVYIVYRCLQPSHYETTGPVTVVSSTEL